MAFDLSSVPFALSSVPFDLSSVPFDLSSVRKGAQMKAPRLVIYGNSGVGKTTFAAGSPGSIVIQTEDGLGTLDVPHFPLADSLGDVMSAIASLYTEDHDFQTLVVDSLDWLEPLIWKQVCTDHNVQSIEAIPYGKGYTEALSYWRSFCQGVTALRDTKSMAIVMIAHSQIVRVEDPTREAYDAHHLKLHKKAAAVISEFSDVIGYAALKTVTVTEEKGFNAKRTRAKTTGERVLHTSPNPAYVAKNRYGLPASIPLDWDSFQTAIQQATAQPTDKE